MTKNLEDMTVEELKELKKRRYELAENRGLLVNIDFIARTLGTRLANKKYEFYRDDIYVFVDDYGGYMQVEIGGPYGKIVCSTHEADRLFTPGKWTDKILCLLEEATLKRQEIDTRREESIRQRLINEMTIKE